MRRRVGLYREHRAPDTSDDLSVLGGLDPEHVVALLQTRQRTGGTLKAAAITEAARRMSAHGETSRARASNRISATDLCIDVATGELRTVPEPVPGTG